MNTKLAPALLYGLLTCWACASGAQTAPAHADGSSPAAAAPAALTPLLLAPPEADRSEPNVTHTVIEDKGSKIDELRVRGQTQHIIVTPKVGTTKPYEIIIGPGGRDTFEGTGGAKSAAGKRVWSVLNF